MKGTSPAEGHEDCAWLGNTKGGPPELNARNTVIPFLPHEVQSVGRVSDDAINAVLGKGRHDFKTIANVNHSVTAISISSFLTSAMRGKFKGV